MHVYEMSETVYHNTNCLVWLALAIQSSQFPMLFVVTYELAFDKSKFCIHNNCTNKIFRPVRNTSHVVKTVATKEGNTVYDHHILSIHLAVTLLCLAL